MGTSEAELRKSMEQYGKGLLNEDAQIRILSFILEDAKNQLTKDSELHKLIAEHQLKLSTKTTLGEAIRCVNECIIDLETKDKSRVTLNYLKKQGVYRILYRNPILMGNELPQNDILHKLLRTGLGGVVLSALIIILFSATAFFAAPLWFTAISTGLFVGASTYLSGILYGVVNDLFATHANLPYFLLGHQPQQKSLLRTNNKIAQGIAWGIAATFGPVVIATILFTVAATITAFFVPMATFLMPIMMMAMPLIAVSAEFYARKKARDYIKEELWDKWMGSNEYQQTGLNYMSPTNEERAAWLANSDRNMFGFTKVPLIGLGALVALLILSGVSGFLPAVLFASPIIAVGVPAAFAAVACISLLAAGSYMYVNRNKHIDDRYRLEFDRDAVEPNLYFNEDMTYVNALLKTYGASDDATKDRVTDSSQSFYEAMWSQELVAENDVIACEELIERAGLGHN